MGKVSRAGKEVLMKTVPQTISTYGIMMFRFSKDIFQSIQALISCF